MNEYPKVQIPSIYFIGDLDGDTKVDLILATLVEGGSDYELFLSSKAMDGFGLKWVCNYGTSCC